MTRAAPIRPARELKSDAGDAERCPADVLNEIATELNLLSQSYRTPEAFLERRDFLVKRMRRLARRLVPTVTVMPERNRLQRRPASAAFFAVATPSATRETLRLKDRP